MQRVGVLWFDDPYGSLDFRDQPAVAAMGNGAVMHVQDPFVACADGSFWLTNLPYKALAAMGLHRRGDLADDAYLLTRPDGMVGELGLRDAPVEQQAKAVAQQAAQCLLHAHTWFGLPIPSSGHNLAVALRRHLFRFEDRTDAQPTEVAYAFDSACQEVTYAGGGTEGRGPVRRAVLRHHRQDYAARLLQMQVPSGEWAELFPPSAPVQAHRWVEDTVETRPLLLRATVRFVGDNAGEMALLTGLGSGARAVRTVDGRQSNLRSWIAAPEYLALAPYAQITIHGALAAERYAPNPYTAIDPVTIGALGRGSALCGGLQLGGRARLTYSVGLLCEAMWMSLVRSGRHRDAVAMWIAAQDRAECLRAALTILDTGFSVRVTGFSRGRIWLEVPVEGFETEEVDALLATVAATSRLVPPVMCQAERGTPRLRMASEMQLRVRREDPPDPALAVGAVAVLGNRSVLQDVLHWGT